MSEITDIVGYTFRSDIYCPNHIVEAITDTEDYDGWVLTDSIRMDVEENLSEIAYAFGIDREREWTFDSEEFPKRVFAWEETEGLQCGTCGESIG